MASVKARLGAADLVAAVDLQDSREGLLHLAPDLKVDPSAADNEKMDYATPPTLPDD